MLKHKKTSAIALIVSLVLAIFLSGCSGNSTINGTTSSSSPAPANATGISQQGCGIRPAPSGAYDIPSADGWAFEAQALDSGFQGRVIDNESYGFTIQYGSPGAMTIVKSGLCYLRYTLVPDPTSNEVTIDSIDHAVAQVMGIAYTPGDNGGSANAIEISGGSTKEQIVAMLKLLHPSDGGVIFQP